MIATSWQYAIQIFTFIIIIITDPTVEYYCPSISMKLYCSVTNVRVCERSG